MKLRWSCYDFAMTAERKLLLKALLKIIIKKFINFFQNYYKSMHAPTTHLQQSIIPTPSQPSGLQCAELLLR